MASSKNKHVRISARDRAVLEHLFWSRVEDQDELVKGFFPSVEPESGKRRLRRLMARGYVERVPYHERDLVTGEVRNRSAYALGARGEAVLRQQHPEPLPERTGKQAPAPPSIAHQVACNKVACNLGKRFVAEHLGQTSGGAKRGAGSRHRPDASFECPPDEEGRFVVHVEIDLGHYSRRRVLEKVRGFHQDTHARELWWVAPNDERKSQLLEWVFDDSGGAIDRLRFFTFSEIEKGEARMRCPEVLLTKMGTR